MNKLVIFPLIFCVVQAADKPADVKAKMTSSLTNTIQQNPKYETLYQPVKYQHAVVQLQPMQQIQALHQIPQLQQKAQYVPIQIVPKQYYVQHEQPQAMIIIAQPALLPQSLVYGSATQQLLNYFHSNPQAKYQLLQGNYQQAQPQQAIQPQTHSIQQTATYMHPVIASPVGNYILAAPPQLQAQPQLVQQASPIQYTHHPVSVQQIHHLQPITHTPQPQVQQQQQQQPQQHPQQQHSQQQHPQQQHHHIQQSQKPSQLSSLAELAQLAAQQYVAAPMKSAPAIVTGFEHFTPEQQAKIKAQLSTHLGSNFHAVTKPSTAQYSAKYVSSQENSDFAPSQQATKEQVATASTQTFGDILKTRYLTNM